MEKNFVAFFLALAFFQSVVSASVIGDQMQACKKKPGWQWQRMSGVGCVQIDCNERPHAHWSYTRECICASMDNIDDPEEDKYSKPCYAPENDSSCPGCLTMCILPTQLCPGEKPATTTTNALKENGSDQEYGVFERDGILYINSRPGETLSISNSDLPAWARYQIATLGSIIAVVGPPDTVIEGDPNVLINGAPVARVGDRTAHGGSIVEGSDRILVNGEPAAVIGSFAVDPMVNPGGVPYVGGHILTGCPFDPKDASVDISAEAVRCLKNSYGGKGEGMSLEDFCRAMERRVRSDPVTGGSAAWALSEFCRPSARYLLEKAEKGTKVLEVDSEAIEVGDTVIIGNDPENSETGKVADKGSIILENPLENSYKSGVLVTKVPRDMEEYKASTQAVQYQKDNAKGRYGIIVGVFAALSLLAAALLIPLAFIALFAVIIFVIWRKK